MTMATPFKHTRGSDGDNRAGSNYAGPRVSKAKDDLIIARANIERAFKVAVRDDRGRVMLYTIQRSPNGYAIFTIDSQGGLPHWLMWSVAKIGGYRLNRSGARDYVTLGGGGYSKADELCDTVARVVGEPFYCEKL